MQAKAMNFKDIMALSTPSERIGKYGEARQILAARDSGLDTWLVHMTTEHPDLPASKSVPGQTSQLTNNATLSSGPQASGQQSHYQQSPSTAGPQSGGGGGGGARSRLGGLSMPSQMSGSALSHSGKEIGNKSKEFMHSAGKMGKGLLSKGKSKLRGSGDKVFH
jgi:serine/arginine repetitive matrix protein 2